MPCASAVMISAASLFLASFFAVNMPPVVISALVRTLTSVLVPTLVAVLTSVPAFGYTTAPFLALARGPPLPSGNPTMSLDPSATTPPMVLYTVEE
ncbi:uncharacterized protein H6S33_006990 [Morchella sextelata]|uniref:uncharacterized protein n=1 Tax=Morchella sextelata TaxID=1174677 RepID=UPI001D054DC3|nr:uncharacterized protein H6S33_006990 [Morchella sextelata]KAH0603959.1 hypothetical protein H6S33_006990 [Morchella sextelata]